MEHDHGGADVVVNNAGIGMAGGLLDTTTDDWERILRVNLWGVIHGSRLFARQMVDRGEGGHIVNVATAKAVATAIPIGSLRYVALSHYEGGHIVNVASAAAFTPSRSLPAYSTTKAAVLMLSECLRGELADADIGVTAICPGIVNTGIVTTTRFVGVGEGEEARRRRETKRLYSLRGFGPEKVADAIVRAVRRDSAVVPVTPEAHLARFVYRFAPGLSRRLARIDPTGRM